MSEKLFYSLQVVSTLSGLIPLVIGVFFFRKADFKIKLFIGLLLAGFITDLGGWYFFLTKNSDANVVIRYGYNLIESLFLFWFVGSLSSFSFVRRYFSRAWVVLIPFWLLSIVYSDLFPVFKSTTEVLIAFASSFCLLDKVERDEKTNLTTEFWLLLGIFFYNFSTFFFMTLLASQMGVNVWYLHNIINILTNVIYCWALTRPVRSGQVI